MANGGEPFLAAQSRDLGFTRQHLERALSSGQLRRVFKGVLVDGAVPDSRDLRFAAARLVLPAHAIVSDHSAAWLFGVDTLPPGSRRDFRLMCIVPHTRHRVADTRVRVRQVVRHDADITELHGVPVTSPERTTADLLRLNHRPYALAAGDAMVRACVVDAIVAQEFVLGLGRVPYARQAMELAPRLDADSESHGESWARCRMMDAGLPRPTLQHEVTLRDGRIRRLDAAFVKAKVASEYDGRAHHTSIGDVTRDQARREEIEQQLYWTFVTATQERIFGSDPSFELQLGELLGIRVRPRTW